MKEGVFYLYANNSVKTLTRKDKRVQNVSYIPCKLLKKSFTYTTVKNANQSQMYCKYLHFPLFGSFYQAKCLFHRVAYLKLEKCCKNQVKSSNYWKKGNLQFLWLCFQGFPCITSKFWEKLPNSRDQFPIFGSWCSSSL